MKYAGTSKNQLIAEVSKLHKQVTELNVAEHKCNQKMVKLYEILNWQEAIIEGSSDAIFISNAASQFTMVNQESCEMTGYSKEELLSIWLKARFLNLHLL